MIFIISIAIGSDEIEKNNKSNTYNNDDTGYSMSDQHLDFL